MQTDKAQSDLPQNYPRSQFNRVSNVTTWWMTNYREFIWKPNEGQLTLLKFCYPLNDCWKKMALLYEAIKSASSMKVLSIRLSCKRRIFFPARPGSSGARYPGRLGAGLQHACVRRLGKWSDIHLRVDCHFVSNILVTSPRPNTLQCTCPNPDSPGSDWSDLDILQM